LKGRSTAKPAQKKGAVGKGSADRQSKKSLTHTPSAKKTAAVAVETKKTSVGKKQKPSTSVSAKTAAKPSNSASPARAPKSVARRGSGGGAEVKPSPPRASQVEGSHVAVPVKPAPPRRIIRTLSRPLTPAPVDKQAEQAAQAARQLELKQVDFYEKAVAEFNNRRYAKALALLQKVEEGPNATFRHRAHVYAEICRQKASSEKPQLKTADDHYNYGIKLMNDRKLDEAEQHLQRALRLAPEAAYLHYAHAVLRALKGDARAAFENLKKAIEIDPQSRVLALNDADLAGVASDPLISQLLHTPGEEQPAG
jgi:hypothetical protein